MARKPRFVQPGYTQHVIQRGLDRKACFFAPSDYPRFLVLLQEAAEKYDCHVHAYVLMTNHIHLLVTQQQMSGVSFMMQRLSQRYVWQTNRTYRRSGTLWEGRYKASLVDTDRYLLTCMHYIEMNPVRAAMVSQPFGFTWSSYRHNACGVPDPIIRVHPLYEQLGSTQSIRCASYRELFSACLDPEQLEEIRHTLNQELVLGAGPFKKQIEEMLGRQASERPKGRPRKTRDGGEY